MSLENYTGNISDLVATNPTGTDPRSQGDDHLRGIKYTLKQSFPLATGPVRVSGDKLFAGDSADQTKNFVIDASADNGTMKLARESGQDIMTVDAAGKVRFPQTKRDWVNESSNRVANVEYTNNTGGEIVVHAFISSTEPHTAIGRVNTSPVFQNWQQNTGVNTNVSLVVPDGQKYLITVSAGTATLNGCFELK